MEAFPGALSNIFKNLISTPWEVNGNFSSDFRMLEQGISFLFFKNKIFLTIVCIIISTAELLSGISPLISMVKKKREKKKCW